MKRIWSILLTLALCLSLFSAMGLTAAASEEKEFWRVKIGTVELSDGQCIPTNGGAATDGNNGGAYVAYFKDGTLYLNDLRVDGQVSWYAKNGVLAFDLTIHLTGTNTVTNGNASAILGETGWVTGRGMSLFIEGDGTLNATGKTYGMWVWKDVTIRGKAKVNVTGTNDIGICNNSNIGTISVSDQATVVSTGGKHGIGHGTRYTASALKITGGSLTASGNDGATLQTPQLGEGVSLQASTSANGTSPSAYDSASHTSYKWIKSTYAAARSYTVTFDTAGGSSVSAQTVSEGQKATKPADPTKAGYTFKGWTQNGASYDFNTAVSGDLTLVATWAPVTYAVSFGANGGTGTMAAATAAGEYTLPQNGFTAPAGKRFKAWSVNGTEKAAGSKITVSGNLTVTAIWEDVPAGHTCKLETVARIDPTCTTAGKEAYFVCNGCGKFFSDAQGKAPISDLSAWGNLEILPHTESDWKSDGENHRKECTVCKAEITGTKTAHIYEEGKCSVCGYEQGAATDPVTPDVSVDSGSTDVSDEPGTNVGTDDSGTDAPSADTAPDTSAGNGDGEEKTGNLLWLWITLPVVLLLGAGAAVFFVLKKKSSAK